MAADSTFEQQNQDQISRVIQEAHTDTESLKRDRDWDYYHEHGFPTVEIERKIESTLAKNRVARLLEIGAGEAKAAAQLKQKYGDKVTITTLDLLPPNPDAAATIDQTIVGDLFSAELPEQSVDIAYSYQVSQYVTDKLGMIRKVSGLLNIGGLLICDVHEGFTTPGFPKIASTLRSYNSADYDISYRAPYFRLIKIGSESLSAPYKFTGTSKSLAGGSRVDSIYEKI